MLKAHRGVTLVELLIALAVNTLLFAAIIAAFISITSHYRKVINLNRFNQQIESVMQLMTNDIRRAGFWKNWENDLNSTIPYNTNPFLQPSNSITTNADKNCILFTYDQNVNGSFPGISPTIDDKRYGFKLTGNIIQIRPPGAAFNCAASDWENMTDLNVIQVTQLIFNVKKELILSKKVCIRSVDITITAQLPSDPSITRTLTHHVNVRNNVYNIDNVSSC